MMDYVPPMMVHRYQRREEQGENGSYEFYTYNVRTVVVVRCYSDAVWEVAVSNPVDSRSKACALSAVVKLAFAGGRSVRRVLLVKVYKGEPFSFYAECGWGSAWALKVAVRGLAALASGDFFSTDDAAEIARVSKHKEGKDLGKTYYYNNRFAMNTLNVSCGDGPTRSQKQERRSQAYKRRIKLQELETKQRETLRAAKKVAKEFMQHANQSDIKPDTKACKAAYLNLAAAYMKLTPAEALVFGTNSGALNARHLRMGSTCHLILDVMLSECKRNDCVFFDFGAGCWQEVMTAMAHGVPAGEYIALKTMDFRLRHRYCTVNDGYCIKMMDSDAPGGCEIVGERAELINKLIEDTCPRKRSSRRSSVAAGQDQGLECDVFRDPIDLLQRPQGTSFDFFKRKVVMKLVDEVFEPETRQRIVYEFGASAPTGSVLYTMTCCEYPHERLTACTQYTGDGYEAFRAEGYNPDLIQKLWVRRVK